MQLVRERVDFMRENVMLLSDEMSDMCGRVRFVRGNEACERESRLYERE